MTSIGDFLYYILKFAVVEVQSEEVEFVGVSVFVEIHLPHLFSP